MTMVSEHSRCRRRRFSSSTLPEEIAEQIIARVPCIKTVLRCTSVCKSWYAFSNSPPFVKSLISLFASNNDVKKLLLCEFDEAIIPRFCVDRIEAFQDSSYFLRRKYQYDGNSTSIEDDDYIVSVDDFIEAFVEAQDFLEHAPYFALHDDDKDFQENCKLVFPRSNVQQLHACNGLICYNTSDDPGCLYLWNPTIQREKKISTPLPNLNIGDYHAAFKLWFDNNANDFRILRITYTLNTCTVEVFSLSTNSWRLITDDAPVTTSFLNSNRLAYINGIFYWPALRDGNWILVSLDIENGMFRERLTRWTATSLYLTPSDQDASLVILGYGDIDDLILDFFGDCCVSQVYNYSLDKFHKFDIKSSQGLQPLGVRNNDELLLQKVHHQELVSYSVEKECLRIFAPATSRKLLRTIPFVQTLALLNDADATRIWRPPNNSGCLGV